MIKKLDVYPKDHSSEARSKRMKYVRKKLGLTQQDMEDKYHIPVKSLQNWERVRYAGLSEKGAERLSSAFITEGLQSDTTRLITWLLYGEGADPTIRTSSVPTQNPMANDLSEEGKIAEELKLFHSHHTAALDAIVVDHGLAPLLSPGDRVAGIRYSEDEIDKTIGLPAIVKTQSGEILIRIIEKAQKDKQYDLICTHPDMPKVKNIKILLAAPIIWIRKHSFDDQS